MLNIPRVRRANALTLASALKLAQSDNPLGPEWADAIADDEVQAARLHARADMARALARARRKRGR